MKMESGWYEFYKCKDCDVNFAILEGDAIEIPSCPNCEDWNVKFKGGRTIEKVIE